MSYQVQLAVISEEPEQSLVSLTLHNVSEFTLSRWCLQFIFERNINLDSITHGKIKQVGSFCTITPDTDNLAINNQYYCEFIVNSPPIRFYAHGIKEAVVVDLDTNQKLPVAIEPMMLAKVHEMDACLTPPEASCTGLIPHPNKIEYREGEITLTDKVNISIQTSMAEKAATWLEQEINTMFGIQIGKSKSDILFALNSSLEEGYYNLEVEAECIKLEANSINGFTHASATLLQLIKNLDGKFVVPKVKIADHPRFTYRGLMLDCARHFHSVSTIKRLINQLAYYKFNHFHWHLTDDEGWRVEIDAFPQLTQIGAKRGSQYDLEPQLSHLTSNHEGYYSKEQIREIIAYAADRSIIVIPEIDIPGHCRAAIKSLPHLLADGEDSSCYLSVQNYHDNTLSPALDGTYLFIDKVLEEIADLFPSPWIHMGGDEVPSGVWKNSQACQTLMKVNHYQSTDELQGHILRYAENKLKSLGKRMLGWEEVKNGNKVSPNTVIVAWTNENAAINSAEQGFNVILQPAQYTYFDLVQDYTPNEPGSDWAGVLTLEKAYRYQPLEKISAQSNIHQKISGLQCALWCENTIEQAKIDYMLFPRLTAFAEVCWTDNSGRDWQDYLSRLKQHQQLMDKQNIQYRYPWKTKT